MSETMTWAGPLPVDSDAPAAERMTFAGPVVPVAAERSSAEEAGATLMWAGPLPSWMERSSRGASVVSFFSPAARI